MKLNPLHDRVVVKRIEADTKTSSGLYIPDNVAEKPDQGIVLAVGAGRRTAVSYTHLTLPTILRV